MPDSPNFTTHDLSSRDETPRDDSSQNISPGERTKKRPIRRRTTTPGATAARSESVRRSARQSDNQIEINNCLTNIYQDKNGSIPNMKKIIIKKKSPVAAAVVLLGAGVVLAIIAWDMIFGSANGNTSTANKAILSLNGPTKVVLGATSTYTLTYENTYDVTLKNLTLDVYYPAGFVYGSSSPFPTNSGHNEWKIGTLGAHQRSSITITGQNYGALNEQKSWRAFLSYRPSNFNSNLEQTATLVTAISSAPITLDITGPAKMAPGTLATYNFTIHSNGPLAGDLYLTPELPPSFTITSSSPVLEKNNRWTINANRLTSASSLQSAGEQTLAISGTLTKTLETAVVIKGQLQLVLPGSKQPMVVARAELKPEVLKNYLALNLAINSSLDATSVSPGNNLSITIRLKNTSRAELKNATLKLALDAPSVKKLSILQWSAIIDQHNGDIKGQQISDTLRRGEITWTSKLIPALANLKPDQEIIFDLTIPVKDGQTIDYTTVAGATIKAQASIMFTDQNNANQTLATVPFTINLNSDTRFESRDKVESSGAHTISWVINNSVHPLRNITASAEAYGDINFEKTDASSGDVTFDKMNKKISWNIQELPESVDVATASFVLSFNKVNPTQNTLLSKVKVTAEDTITGKTIEMSGDEVALK